MAEFTSETRHFFDVRRLVFRIGELAAMADVSARQLRYWEKKGLIASQTREDGQQARVYTFKTFVRVSLIKYYMDEGFTLSAAAQHADSQEDRMSYIHKFVSTSMKGLAEVDGKMAINLGAFDADQTLMAIMSAEGPVRYQLLPNDEAQRLTRAEGE